jgi:hypothetical protein
MLEAADVRDGWKTDIALQALAPDIGNVNLLPARYSVNSVLT